jgi:hypothetical protein
MMRDPVMPEQMADCDRTAVHIHDLLVETELAYTLVLRIQ